MAYTDYLDLNSLGEIAFIAGTDMTLSFTVYDDLGVPLNLAGSSVTWELSPWGQPDVNVLEEAGTIISTSVFTVALASADTVDLYGKYTHQPVITDSVGKIFRPAQGDILIEPAIAAS
jgi:hypothetical protein